MTNLYAPSWDNFEQAEIWAVLRERVGGPGQYGGGNANTFCLPLAGQSCQVELTSSEVDRIVSIKPGRSFDPVAWARVVDDLESPAPMVVGRGYSFTSRRTLGSWRGRRSGVQIVPPPPEAPVAPFEVGEHPFILEFPIRSNESVAITNFRRMREHRRLSLLLNVLLSGQTTIPPLRSRHFWALIHDQKPKQGVLAKCWRLVRGSMLRAAPRAFDNIKWVQEFYNAPLGEGVVDALSPPAQAALSEIPPDIYYARVGFDGRSLEVPDDLDDMIYRYTALSKPHRDSFDRAAFWLDLAARQWTTSSSASFASVAVAIEALGDRSAKARPTFRFQAFIERYAPGASLEARRREMYEVRSNILHGTGLTALDEGVHFGWAPPEERDRKLIQELWGLAQVAVRNWLRDPTP